MKKPTRGRSSGTVIRIPPKGPDSPRAKPPDTVLIDSVYDGELGRFEDEEPEVEGNFYLDPEEDPATDGDRPDALTAVVGAAFDAATTPDQRRRLRHKQAMCAVVVVPTPVWVLPVSAHFRAAFGERWQQQTRHGPLPNEKAFSTSSAAVSLALAAGQSVVGIAAEIGLLPRALIGAADMTVRLAPPNGVVLKAAISRFAKRGPPELDDSIAADLDLPDIVAAFRPGTGPQRIVQRLAAASTALRLHLNLDAEKNPCSL